MVKQPTPQNDNEEWFIVRSDQPSPVVFAEWAGRMPATNSKLLEQPVTCPICGAVDAPCHT